MRIVVILLALLICVPIAFAEKDSATTGPFKVSFDMGFSDGSYTVQVKDPVETESLDGGNKSTEYEVSITKLTSPIPRLATITLSAYEQKQVVPTPEQQKQILHDTLSVTSEYVDSSVREIDGVMGAIATGSLGNFGDATMATWYPSDKLRFSIFSNYPWEEGSLSLVKTIHIENMNQTKQQ